MRITLQQQSFTMRDGTVVDYWTCGNPSGETILMVHGFRGTHHGLHGFAKYLQADYHIIIPNVPGFGGSAPFASGGSTLENYLQFIDETIDNLTDTPPLLLGHSFGSIIASHYTAGHVKKVKKLLLINPICAPALEGPRAMLTKIAIFYYWLGKVLPASVARTWLGLRPIVWVMSTVMRKTHDKTLQRFIDNQHYTYFSTYHSPAQLSESFVTSVSYNARQVAGTLKLPVLLVAGELDDISFVHDIQSASEEIPNSTLVVLPGVGHLTPYETPRQVAEAIAVFCEG